MMEEKILVKGELVTGPRGLVPEGASDQVYEQYLVNMRVRDDNSPIGANVRVALAASSDSRFRNFLDKAMRYRRHSLVTIAKSEDIGLTEFQAFMRTVAANEAIDRAIQALPGITIDMIQDARTQEVTCPACDGTGILQREGKEDRICPNCGGTGTVRTIGDKHARDKIIEMTGVIKKEPAIVINQDMRGVGMAAASTRMKSVPFDFTVEATPVDSKSDPA